MVSGISRSGHRWATSVLLAAGVFGLTACGGDAGPQAPARTAAPSTGTQAQTSAQTPLQQLLERADLAVKRSQLFAPAGQSAFELYLQVLELAPDQSEAQAALIDLSPYGVLYLERLLIAGEREESRRILGLLERLGSGKVPALPRLRELVADLERNKEVQMAAQPIEVESRGSDRAASSLVGESQVDSQTRAISEAQPMEAPPRPASQPVPAPKTATDAFVPTAMNTPVAAPVVEVDTTLGLSRIDLRSETAELVEARGLPSVISLVQPRYPSLARRRRIEGRVEVGFTVMPDGSVSNVRVLKSHPGSVFDREAINAMERWRFAPSNHQVEGRRVFEFKLQ